MRLLLPAVFLAISVFAACTADREKPGVLPEPPPPVKNYRPPLATKNTGASARAEPEVTVTTHGEERREEFRMSGRLYMIKVTPKGGRPYYLVDKEGKGEFVKDDIQHDISPPMWVIRF
jgi:hypothetical protein